MVDREVDEKSPSGGNHENKRKEGGEASVWDAASKPTGETIIFDDAHVKRLTKKLTHSRDSAANK